MATSQEIFNDAQARLKDLETEDASLNTQLSPLEDKLQLTGLTASEQQLRATLNDSIANVRSAHLRLTLITLAKLDNTPDLAALSVTIASVIGDLDKTKNKILKFGQIASNITNILNGVQMLKGKIDMIQMAMATPGH